MAGGYGLTPTGTAVYDQFMQPIYNRMRAAGEFDFDAVNRLIFGASWVAVNEDTFEAWWQNRLDMGDPADTLESARSIWEAHQAEARQLAVVVPDPELRERLVAIWVQDFWRQ